MSNADGSTYGVVVVGGGAGIGAATASLMARRHGAVYIIDRDVDAASRTVERLLEEQWSAASARADVTDEDSIRDAFAEALEFFGGRVDAVINTAGVQGPLGAPSHEVAVEDFTATIAINLTAALILSRVVIPHMLANSYGRIVHVASIAGKEGNPNMVAYSSSKAGLIGLVKTQGKEYAGTGITVNALAPAVIHTPFLDTQPTEVLEYMTAKIPMGRVGTVEETAEMLAFIASPACSFTTGFTFDLSGGRATY